mgnify:CR=1 FL=1
MGYCEKCITKYGDYLYVLFRALIGLLFFMHGWSKFAGGFAQGVYLAAAIIEVVAGVGIFFGMFTRALATVSAVEMAVAFFMVHVPQGLNPLANQGEAAVLYFAAFLVLAVYGNKKWNLEQMLLKKEMF